MKNSFLRVYSIVILLLSVNFASAQIVLTEGFESTTFPPAGWTLSTIGGPGFNYWGRFTAGTFPTCSPNTGSAMARFNSRTPASGSTQTLFSPSFDLSDIGSDTARVRFWIYRNDSSATATPDYDTLDVLINTSASLTGAVHIGTVARDIRIALPDTQPAAGWYAYSFDIPQGFNGSINHLMFRGTKQSATNAGYRIFIDDIEYDSYPAPCSGLPVAGVLSGTDTLICTSGVITLSVSGTSVNQPGLVYQWQSADSVGGVYTDFGNGGLVQVSDTLFSTTVFRFVTICSLTGDSAFSNEWLVRVDTAAPVVLTVSDDSVTYCNNSGNPVLLSVSGADTYLWSPAQGLSSTTTDTTFATPFFSTTYTVIGSNLAGCTTSATIRVTVSSNPTVNVTSSSSTVCTGDSVTLSATAFGGGGGGGGGQIPSTFLWSPSGLVGNTITVAVDSSTTIFVTGTSIPGCSGVNSIDSVSIATVDTPLAGSISASDTVVCGGPNAVQLSASVASVGSFAWFQSGNSTGPWVPTSSQGSTILTDTLNSPTYFIAVASCPNGNSDTTDVLFVNVSTGPAPSVLLNTIQSYYCQAANPVLLVASGALFYDWTPATGLNSTFTDSVYAAPLQSTTYLVTGYDLFGCSDTATVRVSVRPNPNVTVSPQNNSICEGDSITLTASANNVGPGGTMNYVWQPGGQTGNTVTVTPALGLSEFIVIGTSSFGCSNANSIDTSVVVVNPLPTASFAYTISSDTVSFAATTFNVNSLTWDFGDGSISTDSVVSHVYSNGTYTAILTAVGPCGTVVDSVQFTINVVGLNDAFPLSFSISPNPTSNWFEVKTDEQLTGIELLDVTGRVIDRVVFEAGIDRYRMQVDHLVKGAYLVKVDSNTAGSRTQRLIVR